MDINVRLSGRKSGNARQSKLSAKGTHHSNKIITQNASNNSLNALRGAKQFGGSVLGGSTSLISFTANAVKLGIVYNMAKSVEKGLNVLSQYRESRSGESMLESNYRAKVKTGFDLGLNIVYGTIRNNLFKQPQIVRQNMSINYERELYNYSIYSEKYKWR